MKPELIVTEGFEDYRLLDMGEGRKLEKFGHIIVDRPEPQAMMRKRLKAAEWAKADAVFTGGSLDEDEGRWKSDKPVAPWQCGVMGVKFEAQLTNFRHMGFFPEQYPHWDYAAKKLAATKDSSFLNLFGYTGVASLIAAKAGAKVTHNDASKKAIIWAKKNQEISRLPENSIRWICEDARSFVAREVRRGNSYTGIAVDPPKFGRGTDGEIWDVFNDLPKFLEDCAQILAPENSFLIMTTYAIRASHIAFYELARSIFGKNCTYTTGELAVKEWQGDRLLTTSHYVRIER